MILPFPRRGLYAVTSDRPDDESLLTAVSAAIRGGTAVIQYRDKRRPPDAKRRLARRLSALCHAAGVPLIINDDIALAAASGADGVHLGKEDAGIAEARAVLGPDAIVGVSCYDSLERARQAQAAGASYVAFGSFFPSGTKPLATPAAPDTLRRARPEIVLPIVAIGGITPANGRRLVEAGASLIAAIEGLFGQSDPEQAARAYNALFSTKCDSARDKPTP